MDRYEATLQLSIQLTPPPSTPPREQDQVPSVLNFVGYSARARDILQRLKQFMQEHVYPAEMVSNQLRQPYDQYN